MIYSIYPLVLLVSSIVVNYLKIPRYYYCCYHNHSKKAGRRTCDTPVAPYRERHGPIRHLRPSCSGVATHHRHQPSAIGHHILFPPTPAVLRCLLNLPPVPRGASSNRLPHSMLIPSQSHSSLLCAHDPRSAKVVTYV